MVKKIRRKDKTNKKKIKSLERDLNSLPEECSFCRLKFNLTKDADTWMVTVKSGESPILICPKCYSEGKNDS